ncbi:MAG: glycosyl transferase family 36, partial [Methylocystis sp.]|nr:glycosyl transferase family 36 [Methylocystis sp.]
MALSDSDPQTGGALFERIAFGSIFALVAALEAAGGRDYVLVAGFFAATAIFLLRPAIGRIRQGVDFVMDFVAAGAFALLCDPAGALWHAPETFDHLFAFTPLGTGVAVISYIVGFVTLTGRSRVAIRAALFLLPFLFSLFVALGSKPIADLGGLILLGFDVPEMGRAIVGRTAILFILNEAVVVGAPLALGRFLPSGWRSHGVLFVSALVAALTPLVASVVSSPILAASPAPFAAIAAAVAAALAQAGLWGETYLVTQAVAGLLRASPSLAVMLFDDWKTGASKGAVYGLAFMSLVLAVGMVAAWPPASGAIAASGLVGAALIGALAFPLVRTIVESTDSTSSFRARLELEYRRRDNYPRGLVAGAAIGVGLSVALPAASGGMRFLFGAATGVLAYAGVDCILDLTALRRGARQHLRSWRVYALGTLLGGLVAGAVAWYLDTGQIATIVNKFFAYTALSYAADGRPVTPYVIHPLFSKWGATDLGLVDSGVRLFFDESLSGVIQWVFAAPLFSVNLFFLTALVRRDLQPLRQLASREGLDLLVDNAVRVVRWGLWMAPVIYSFLKAAPDPTWYNQDGLIRSGVATWMNYALPGQDFRAWSLDIFTVLLDYDALRV